MFLTYARNRIKQLAGEILILDNRYEHADNVGDSANANHYLSQIKELEIERDTLIDFAALEEFKLVPCNVQHPNPREQTITRIFDNCNNSAKPEIISHIG